MMHQDAQVVLQECSKKWCQKLLDLTFSIGFMAFMIYFLLKYVFSFNYEITENDHYELVIFLPFLLLPIIQLFLGQFSLKLSEILGLLMLPVITVMLWFSKYYSFSNEYFYNVCVIAMLCYGVLLMKSVNMIKGLLLGNFVCFLVQLCLGLKQVDFQLEQDSLTLVGTLKNSGVYALYLTLNLPLVYYVCISPVRQFKNILKVKAARILLKGVFALILVCVCGIIYYTQSRTAILTLFGFCTFLVITEFKIKLRTLCSQVPKLLLPITGIMMIGSLGWIAWRLLHLKKMSAVGRFVNSEIALQHIQEHFWTGVGIGRFSWYYPQWQAEYFGSQLATSLDRFFSASEIYIIFNEYLQLFMTIGLLGSLVLGIILYQFFNLESLKNRFILSTMKCAVFGILCSALTSYPLHVNATLLLFGFCIVSAFVVSARPVRIFKSTVLDFSKTIFLAIIGLCLMILTYGAYSKKMAVDQWEIARKLPKNDALNIYHDIYPELSRDGKYLSSYASARMADPKADQFATRLAQQSQDFIFTRESTETLIESVYRTKQYDLAIKYQTVLVNYLPNKFSPKYKLMLLQELKGDIVKTREVGNQILNMPVKVPSVEVEMIKHRTREILKKYL